MKQFLFILLWLASGLAAAQEICNNGIDDDSDGEIDCADGDCFSAGHCPAVFDLTPAICEDSPGSGNATVDLTTYEASLTDTVITISWYEDASATIPAVSPTSYTVVDGNVLYAEVDNGTNQDTASVSFTVNNIDDAGFTYTGPSYCPTDTDPVPSVNTSGGTFSSAAGLVINSSTGEIDVSASTAAAYTVTYTTSGTCPNSATFNVTINAEDDASFSYGSAMYCSYDADPSPTVTTAGGTFSSTAGLILNSSTGEVDLDTSTPGTYTVTYTTAGVCPANSTFDVTINAADDASFSYASTSYCQDATDPTPTVATAGGTFSSTAGLVINGSTGEVDVSSSTPATYMVTYLTAGTCPFSGTFSITINSVDDAGFTYASSTYCPTDTDPTPSVNTPGGTFSAPAGLIINSSTGEIDLSTSDPGDHTVTYTTSGICPNSATFDIAILDAGEPTAQPAAGITCDAFTAVWDSVFGAANYEVDVAEDPAFVTMVAGYSAAATADTFLNISGLTATQTYYYRVRSISSCGTSLNSDTIAVEVIDIPVGVSNLTASNPECEGFNISWDAVNYASSYLLEVSQDGFVTTDFSVSISSTSLALGGLLDQGTTYEYRVTPQNVCGSGPSNTGTYQTSDVPATPTNVAPSQVVCDGAMITWDEVVEADQYLVEISADTFATVISYPISNDTLIVNGLTSATSYQYRIIPSNTCGAGDTTAVLTFATDSLPSAAMDSLLAVEYNQVSVAWDTIVNADDYTVEVATDDLFASLANTVVSGSTSVTVTGLTPLTTYYLRVFANNSCGSGPAYDTLTFTTPQNPLVIDSLAVVDFYNATDGPNWTDNTNWLSGTIDSWQGVTVIDNRVAQLELSNNQLSGSFPTSMSDLTGLIYANLRDNALSGTVGHWISNFSELTDSLLISGNQLSEITMGVDHTSGVIDLANNQLTFEDLLPVVDSLSNLVYAPQTLVGSTTNTFRNAGDSYTLSLGIDVSVVDNQYVWYRNGVAIDTTSTHQYVMDTLIVSDDGTYTCEITNLGAPNLTLVSNPMTVNVQAMPNSLTFTEIADASYGSTPFVMNASATSGLPVYYEAIEGDSLVEIQGDVVTLVGIGQVTIQASQPGDDFHEAATPITRQFTINQGSQTIAFSAINDQDIALTNSVTLAISASSDLPIDFTIDGPAELEGDILWLLDTGVVTLTASQAGDTYYQPAFPVSQSFLVFNSDTIPVVTETPVDSTSDYTISVQVNSSLSATASLHKASGSSFTTENEESIVAGNGAFSDVPGGYYSLRLIPSDNNYLPTYIGNQLTLAQASILGLTQDTTLAVSLIAKPDTTAQQGVIVGGTLTLEETSGGRVSAETALNNVAVYLVQQANLAVVGYGATNAQGVFGFPNIPAGDYFFLADYEGIEFLDNEITVADNALTLDVVVDKFITIRSQQEEVPPALITGIGETVEVTISTYPNPVVNRLTIEIPANWLGSLATLVNTAGQQMMSQVLTGAQDEITLQALPAGLYYLRVQNGHHSRLMKVVKK